LTDTLRKSLSLTVLLGVVGVLAGGFYTAVSGICSVFLLIWLFFVEKEKLKFVFNPFSCAILCCFAFYCLTPLWAADHGMALLGIVRFLPIVLFLLLVTLKKYSIDLVFQLCCILGAGMTVVSLIGMQIPALEDFFSVAGRISGTFGYPNTFAAFLTVCLTYQLSKGEMQKYDWGINLILCVGLLYSGSRGAFIWAAIVLVIAAIVHRRWKQSMSVFAPLIVCILAAYLLETVGVSSEANRYLSASTESGTFLARLLYYKDALRESLSHPFGLGYWGYRAALGTFQTGRYAVSFVHNDLIQMLLEIGWIPTLVFVFGVGWLFWKGNAQKKLLLLALLGHSMIDFDQQFLIMWLLLIALSDIEHGKTVTFRANQFLACAVMLVCVWLSAADVLYTFGSYALCDKIAPWHTEAKIKLLTKAETAEEMERIGNDILALNSSCSIAFSACAEVAYSQADFETMRDSKNQAIDCAPYALAEYTNYLDKLFVFYEYYASQGDARGAQTCVQEMCSVVERIAAVEKKTDRLAVECGEDQSMALPRDYLKALYEIGAMQ